MSKKIRHWKDVFSPYVEEPTVEQTIGILRGIKEKYEVHHNIHITDTAIIAVATLSNRYISDRQMPDKAIDLIDEVASRLKMEIESLPQPIDTLQRTINAKKIELQALKRETDKATMERVAAMEEDIANMEEECHQLYGQWQAEKSAIDAISLAKEQIEEANHELEVATRHGDFQGASEIKFGKLPQLHKELEKQQQALADMQQDGGMLREEVTEEDIALVVSRWTGVPVNNYSNQNKSDSFIWKTTPWSRHWSTSSSCRRFGCRSTSKSGSSRSKQTYWLLYLFGTYRCW